MRVLVLAGERCQSLMDSRMWNLHRQHLQLDEIWTCVQKNNRRVRKGDSPEIGDAWVYVAIDADTKLVPAFHIGKRHLVDTRTFLWDLYGRIEGRTQITTDGLHHYTASVPDTFGLAVDFAQLVKLIGDYGQHDGPDPSAVATKMYPLNPSSQLIMNLISHCCLGNEHPLWI